MGNKCERHFCNETEPKKHNLNWMKSLSDSALLSSLTIPGTHNSCSFFGGSIAITQTWPIPLQLKAGIRYFDIRLRRYKNKLRLQHGVMNQKCFFDVILKDFKEFLTEQPTETIIMAVQEEYKAKTSTKDMNTLFEEYTVDYNDLIVEFKGQSISLGSIRGKILFVNVFHSRINWITSFKPQNDWVVNQTKNIVDKKRKIKKHFNRTITFMNENFIYLNYLSGVSNYGIVTPSHCAYETNKEVFKFKGRLGIVLCDFPGEELIEYLIEENFLNNVPPIGQSIEIINKSTINIIHINTKKYLAVNSENNQLICSKEKYDFIISTKDDQNGVYDNDIITLKNTDNSFKTQISIMKKQPIYIEKKTLHNIYKGDFAYILIKDKQKEKKYLSSDYSLKINKIQRTILTPKEDNTCEWIIEM